MKKQRCVWALLAAVLVFGSFGVAEANAWGRRAMPSPNAGGYYGDPGAVYPYYDINPYGNPYVLPLPAYGILPPPVTGSREFGPYRGADSPRMRPSIYPAVPYEKTPEVNPADRRRARFEITVPFADAIVTFDGAETKQSGLNRVFVSPPLDEGKEYTVTIMTRWPTEDGGLSAPRQKAFTVKAGDTIQHTFIK